LCCRTRGVPRGDAQDARASPLPPLCIPPPGHVHPPPPQPERLVIEKMRQWATRKKCKFVHLNNLIETSPCPVPGRVCSTAARNCPASGSVCPAAACAVFGHDCPTLGTSNFDKIS